MKYRDKTDAELQRLQASDRARVDSERRNLRDRMKKNGVKYYQPTPPSYDWELQEEITRRYTAKEEEFKRKYILLPLGILFALGILLWFLTH